MSEPDKSPLGVIGANVVRNIEELRKERGMSHTALSAEMGRLGRPVGDTVLHRQSQGRRRVDADDLVAFALALGVNPNALLLDRRAKADDLLPLTPEFGQAAWLVWAWASGQVPMIREPLEPGEAVVWGIAEQADFITYTVPDTQRRYNTAATRAVEVLANTLRGVLSQPEENRKEYAETLRRALQRVQLEVDEMLADDDGGPALRGRGTLGAG